MNNTKTHLGSYWPIYAIGAADIFILAIAYRYLTLSDGSFEWPAWIQAVGSISAILVAIWVSSHQVWQQRTYDLAREQDELDGVLRSIRGEVFTTQLYFASEVTPAFSNAESGQQIRTIFSLPEYPFPIFDGLIPKLGMISDKKLLQDIIRAYAQTKSFALTAKVHNSSLRKWRMLSGTAAALVVPTQCAYGTLQLLTSRGMGCNCAIPTSLRSTNCRNCLQHLPSRAQMID
jgi:hypothetical protein